MVYRCETFKNHKEIVILQSLKISHLSIIPNRFYEVPKLKNWMCELCTFSQIRSHIAIATVEFPIQSGSPDKPSEQLTTGNG